MNISEKYAKIDPSFFQLFQALINENLKVYPSILFKILLLAAIMFHITERERY